jgi:hypothetical protein
LCICKSFFASIRMFSPKAWSPSLPRRITWASGSFTINCCAREAKWSAGQRFVVPYSALGQST